MNRIPIIIFFSCIFLVVLFRSPAIGSEERFPWYLYEVVDPDLFSSVFDKVITSSDAKEYLERKQNLESESSSRREDYIDWDNLGLKVQLEIVEAERSINARASFMLDDVKSPELVFYENYWGKVKDPYYLNEIKESTLEGGLDTVVVWVGKLSTYEDTKNNILFARWQSVNDSNFAAKGRKLLDEGVAKYKNWEGEYYEWLEKKNQAEDSVWNKITGNDKVEPLKAPEWLRESDAKSP